MDRITTFLMFTGQAAEAMELYTSLFEDSAVLSLTRYGDEGPGAPGTVKQAVFRLAGREFMCTDSPPVHAFTFTPSMSLFVTCGSEEEQERLFERLSAGGGVLMELGEYGFSQRFGWVADRFGVSWQLNLP